MKASADPDLLSDLCAFPYKQQQELIVCAKQSKHVHPTDIVGFLAKPMLLLS